MQRQQEAEPSPVLAGDLQTLPNCGLSEAEPFPRGNQAEWAALFPAASEQDTEGMAHL